MDLAGNLLLQNILFLFKMDIVTIPIAQKDLKVNLKELLAQMEHIQ